MPKSKVAFKFSSDYIEALHDRGLKLFWPDVEPVQMNDCLYRTLLESVPEQPFQSGYGMEFYPTIEEKAACLFVSIVTGHIFGNGNKRTGVLALDQFLAANAIFLNLSNDEAEKLATQTAIYRDRGKTHKEAMLEVATSIRHNSFPFSALRLEDTKFYRYLHRWKRIIRDAQQISIDQWRQD